MPTSTSSSAAPTASSSRGTKAIVTAAPYVHELLVMPCRNMARGGRRVRRLLRGADRCAGLTIVARPAGRPGEAAAKFCGKYGQSTGVCLFDRVFVPWERVFCAGERQQAGEILLQLHRAASAHLHRARAPASATC